MMPRTRRAGRLVAAIACAVAATATTATPAFAYFRTGSIATARASVAQLTAPENVRAVAVPGATSVSVTWRAGLLPEGIVLDGYRVTRVENGTTTKNACTSSPSIMLSPTTVACDDQDVADGTYTYRVTAVFRTWSRTSDASEPVTVARDVDAPSADVTFPEYGHHYGPGQFDSGCSPTGACGTAADPSGVKAVSVSFSDGSSRFWDGHAFTGATPLYFAAELAAPGAATTSW